MNEYHIPFCTQPHVPRIAPDGALGIIQGDDARPLPVTTIATAALSFEASSGTPDLRYTNMTATAYNAASN
ncbi:MAG: hypothetical protein WD928_06375 [Gammaproteobacteria bacterium]